MCKVLNDCVDRIKSEYPRVKVAYTTITPRLKESVEYNIVRMRINARVRKSMIAKGGSMIELGENWGGCLKGDGVHYESKGTNILARDIKKYIWFNRKSELVSRKEGPSLNEL